MSGVEIPSPLIEAHESSELVIFVGAGASIPWPSDLPGFKKLVETIRDQSNLRSVIGEVDDPLDELLSNIEKDHGVNVHERAARLLDKPGSTPSAVHEAIAKLASATTVRVVTTNYDRHLSTPLGPDLPEYLAPALPVGDDFSGIVYLHGSLTQEPRKLVLTADDFGKAYLTDAWAARFLDRMFASHPVLFVGYSHTDTIMKYLARGLGGRSAKRYALTNDANLPLWRQLGITPIECSYDDLPLVLDEWADRARYGLLGHREHVKALVENQDPSLLPEAMSYLESIVSRKDTVKFFTLYARGKSWLSWAAGRPEFASLFYARPQIDPAITRELADWVADNYLTDDELSDISLEIVSAADGQLGPELAYAICRRLSGQTMPMSARMRQWLLVVIEGTTYRYQITFMEDILRKSFSAGDINTALFLFSYLTEPQLKLASSLFGGAFDVEMRSTHYFLNDLWANTLKPALPTLAEAYLEIADQHLRQADLKLALADDTGSARNRPSVFRLEIEPVPDDQHGTPLGVLVDVARDCVESLLDAAAPEGHARLEAWEASDVILLRRLAIHGWTHRQDKTASEKIRWLLETRWLRSYGLRLELSRLITDAIGSADADVADELVREILSQADDDGYAPQRAYAWLTRIVEASPSLTSAVGAVASLAKAHPEVVEPPGSGPTQSAWSKPPPATADEFHRKLASDLSQTVEALNGYETEKSRYEDETRWDRLTGVMSDMVQNWPTDGFILLDAVGPGHPDIERTVVRGWARAQPDTDLAARILRRIKDLDLPPILGQVTFMLAGLPAPGTAAVEWHNLKESRDLAKKCWDTLDPATVSGAPGSDPVTVAINHPAGHLAFFWVAALSSEWSTTRDWSGIPPDMSDYLRGMLETNDRRGEMVEVVFGEHLYLFYEADAEWCKQVVLPRFDWSDEGRAHRAWNGYLSGGRWNNQLVGENFVQKMLATLQHRDGFRADRVRRLFIQLAGISIYADTDPRTWLPDLLTSCSATDRVDWADTFGYELSDIEPALAERAWRRWIHDYWSNRTVSVPKELDAAEASAMARWALFFTDSMEAAIDLVLRTSTAGFETHTLFFHDLTNDRIDRAPEKVAKMVRHLLGSTTLADGQSFHYGPELKRIYTKFSEHSVSADVLGGIAEEAMRLGVDLS